MAKKNNLEKFFLEVGDDVDEALEAITGASGDEVVLNVPRDSVLGKSVKNFRFLKKKADTMGKLLKVESIDDHVLELADLADLDSVNPIFQTRGRAVYDIVPGGGTGSDDGPGDDEEDPVVSGMVDGDDPVESRRGRDHKAGDEEEEVQPRPAVKKRRRVKKFRKKMSFSLPSMPKVPLRLPASHSLTTRLAVLVLVLGVAGWGLATVLPRATVTLQLKRHPIAFAEKVKVDTKTSEPSVVGETVFIPGELLTATKNMELKFPATAEDTVEREATGKLTIFNEFSSESQVLVARTRFETPDGKVFRLFEQVTVPGAQVSGGEIETSSVEVEVYADEAGESHNIGPIDKFTIPGFAGSPRFEGFFARSFAPMTGGYSGVQKVATEEDADAAKEEIRGQLLDALQGEIAILMSDRFQVLEDTTSFTILKEEVLPPEPGGDMASIFVEAEMRQFVFDTSHLEDTLVAYAREKGKLSPDVEFAVDDLSLSYGEVLLDLGAERAEFTAEGEVVFIADVNTGNLTASLLGKSSEEVKKAIFKLPGLDRARVSLWPFWVKKVPKNEKKVEIKVE